MVFQAYKWGFSLPHHSLFIHVFINSHRLSSMSHPKQTRCICQSLIEASVTHLPGAWGMKWCAVSSGKDMIYCLTPWSDLRCLITMSADHKVGLWLKRKRKSNPHLFSGTSVLGIVNGIHSLLMQNVTDWKLTDKVSDFSSTAVIASFYQGKLESPT